MSPLRRQSTIFLQSKLTEELNSESPWIDGVVYSAFQEDPFRTLEGAAAPLEAPPALPTDHPLLSFDDDHFGPPSATSGDAERVGFADFTPDACNMVYSNQPDDLFDHVYQAAYSELFSDSGVICAPVQTTVVYGTIQQTAQDDQSVTTFTQIHSITHLQPTPVGPSTMTTYPPYFDYNRTSSLPPTTPGNASIASLPPTSPPAPSPHYESSESDGESEYVPPSDDDDEYRPTQATSSQKQKNTRTTSQTESPGREVFSPARSTSSDSEKSAASPRAHRRSHPYKRRNASRNLQRDEGDTLIDKESDFQCPVVGCNYVQLNERIPDLKRHVLTHDRWMEPDKWTCCGVPMDRAHLYGKGIREGMTDQERIKAGAYWHKDRLMIGGCLKTFARRDALKRHVDNPKIPCVGHMDSYY